MKVCVIGAGVSGLAVSDLLAEKGHSVFVYEKASSIGGIAKTKQVNNTTYHMIGGHCFNSKHEDVLEYVFSKFPAEKWNKIERDAKIYFKKGFINYPIEFSIKEIAELDLNLAKKIILDLFGEKDYSPKNLADWFKSKFGASLAESYFIPYNKKIWGMDPCDMSFDWVKDKLPNPNKDEILESLLSVKKDDMPHSVFYYPKSNDQMDFINSLANGQDIKFNTEVIEIKKVSGGWLINGTDEYDVLISTIPLNILPRIIYGCPKEIVEAASLLNYNRVSTMLWESEETSNTWTYFPEENTIFHRHIHIGNFMRPKKNVIITEAIGNIPFEIMESEGSKFDHLIRPMDYNVSEHAYVLYDANYFSYKETILNYLKDQCIFTLGRFGEWEYYNMDICIKSALDLSKKININGIEE